MIRTLKSKVLRNLFNKGDAAGIKPEWLKRVRLILNALDDASRPEDLDIPGLGFHPLTANLSGRFAVTVSRNWRITFSWDEGAIDVDLEDYHG